MEQQLRALLPQLREQGMQQLSIEPHHDFLLRLAQSLDQGDAARWRQRLTRGLPSMPRVFPCVG
ncbi:hypothetical protein AU254_20390 [Yersinia pestis]|nr:hypothetical protein AU254_20390 [Yersinia pestis]